MHLKKNPKCYQFAVRNGYCGVLAGPGIGSKWKGAEPRIPLFARLQVEVIEVQQGQNAGRSGSLVQKEVDGLAGDGCWGQSRIQGIVDDQNVELQSILLKSALFPDKYAQALQQACDISSAVPVRVCCNGMDLLFAAPFSSAARGVAATCERQLVG